MLRRRRQKKSGRLGDLKCCLLLVIYSKVEDSRLHLHHANLESSYTPWIVYDIQSSHLYRDRIWNLHNNLEY